MEKNKFERSRENLEMLEKERRLEIGTKLGINTIEIRVPIPWHKLNKCLGK